MQSVSRPLLAICLAALAAAFDAAGATLQVNSTANTIASDGVVTLAEAITAANNDSTTELGQTGSGTDTITFAPALSGQTIRLGGTRLPNLSTHMSIVGPGMNLLTISGDDGTLNDAPDTRIFRVMSGIIAYVSGMTMIDGHEYGEGGTIHNAGYLELSDVAIRDSASSNEGGAIQNLGTLVVADCIFSNNTSGAGGAITCSKASTTLDRTTLVANRANSGGAIYNYAYSVGSASITMRDCTLSKNVAGKGGACFQYVASDDGTYASVSAERCTFSGNETLDNLDYSGGDQVGGGAFYSDTMNYVVHASAAFANCTFSGNKARLGGAIRIIRCNVTLESCTLTENVARPFGALTNLVSGGAIFGTWGGSGYFGSVTIANTIIASNRIQHLSSYGTGEDIDALLYLTSQDYNLIGNKDGVYLAQQAHDRVGTSTAKINPLLGPLQNNGGYTATHALRQGSPAYDAGRPTSPKPTDQRGVARPANAQPDIGAYEEQNAAPTAVADAGAGFSTDEDTPFTTGSVLANDWDTNAWDTALSVQGCSTTGMRGSVVNNGNGTFNYNPNGQFNSLAPGQCATDSFVYAVQDLAGWTNDTTVHIVVWGANDAPMAADDGGAGFSTMHNRPFTTANVLTNDTDADALDTLSLDSLITTVTRGSVSNNGNGTVRYDPNGQFDYLQPLQQGTDTFDYVVSDGHGGMDTGTVTVVVARSNSPPSAVADGGQGFSTDEDTPILTGNVLYNDVDPDPMDVLSVVSLSTAGTLGTVSNATDGSFLYSPNGQFNWVAEGQQATDTFSYVAADIMGAVCTGNVSILLYGLNDTPLAVDDAGTGFTTRHNTPFTTGNVLANDTDPDTRDTLSLLGMDATGALGSVSNNGDGTFLYNPNHQFDSLLPLQAGTDTFSYVVSDGHGGTDTGVVTVIITIWNTAPNAADDSGTGFETDEDTPFTTGNVLVNDVDADTWDTLSVQGLSTAGTLGSVSNNGNGTIAYSPNGPFSWLAAGQSATDTFAYVVHDLVGACDTATVSVVVQGINDAPVALGDGGPGFTTGEDAPLVTPNVLTNDYDPDSADSIWLVAMNTNGLAGSVTNRGDGTLGYDPRGRFDFLPDGGSTNVTFAYTIQSSDGLSTSATVTITVTGTNDAPAANDDAGAGYVTHKDAAFTTGNALANDTDPDTVHLLVVSVDTNGTIGTVANNGDGTFAYNPDGRFAALAPGESASDSFGYTITDGVGSGSTTQLVDVAYDSIGTLSVPSLVAGGITATGSANVYVLNWNGLGIAGGISDTTVDGSEWVEFSFDGGAATDVSYIVGSAGNLNGNGMVGERYLTAFGTDGASLGTVSQDDGGTFPVSSLFGNKPISKFRLQANVDTHRISGVTYSLVTGSGAATDTGTVTILVRGDTVVALRGTARSAGGGMQLTASGEPGTTYTLEQTPSLIATNYSPVTTATCGATGDVTFVVSPLDLMNAGFFRMTKP